MDRTQLAKLAADLVAIPSVNPLEGPVGQDRGEKEIAHFVTSRLEEAGVACELRETILDRPSVLARVPGETEEAIWFDAHIDTVSPAGMAFEPFAARIEGEKLYGRGAADNKGSLAGMMAALIAVAKGGAELPATVIFTATADEEYRMLGVLGLLESGLRARAAVVGEPTDLTVIIGHKGFARFKVTTAGKAVHSSRPENGVNAIYRMSRAIRALETYADEVLPRDSLPLFGRRTLSVGVVRGGEYANVVPDRCEAEVDRRLLPGEDGAQAVADVRAYLASQLEGDLGVEVHDPHLMVPGYRVPSDHPFVQAVAAAVARVKGESSLQGMVAATHAGPIAAAGIPVVVLGPGDMGEAHTAEEALDLDSLEQSAAVYEALMRSGCR